MKKIPFPLLKGFEPTRETMHWYARAIGVLPRVHAEVQPKWAHVSLNVGPDGLYTERMALPDGRTLRVKMDFGRHDVVLLVDGQETAAISMKEGLTSTAFGERLLETTTGLGLTGTYERHRFENEEPRKYDPRSVPPFWQALTNADRVFKAFRATLSGEPGPVQFWSHGFDLAFEWYGERVVTYEEEGQVREYPSQINLGFYPGNPHSEPYFYSNPWPFDEEQLLDKPLPEGGRWQTEGWQGTILPYAVVAGSEDAEKRLVNYARVVHDLAAPLLS